MKTKAFSLIELTVTVFIILILTAVSVPMLRTFQKTSEAKSVAYEIKSAILQAQNFALAPRTGGKKIASYTIKFYNENHASLPNSYEIIECQSPNDPNDPKCAGGVKELLPETARKLPNRVKILCGNGRYFFGWSNGWSKCDITSTEAEITFFVEKQGDIYVPSGMNQFILVIDSGGNQSTLTLVPPGNFMIK